MINGNCQNETCNKTYSKTFQFEKGAAGKAHSHYHTQATTSWF